MGVAHEVLRAEATESTEIFFSLPIRIEFCFIPNCGEGLLNHSYQSSVVTVPSVCDT